MSDLIYRQAVTEDGEPVEVTEDYRWHHDGALAEGIDVSMVRTRPCSWAVFLPGDVVNWYDRFGDLDGLTYPAVVITVGADYVMVGLDDGSVIEVTKHDGTLADLTLVCGSPEDNPHRFGDDTNPAWRWDR